MCAMSVLDERFHVSSTVTVRTSAVHVSPSTSRREAPSTNPKDTVNQTDTSSIHHVSNIKIIKQSSNTPHYSNLS